MKKNPIRHAMLAFTLAFTACAATAQEPIRIGVISSITGPIAFVGISHKNSLALLPAKIGGSDVSYIFYDDASDPTQTVRLVKKLLTEDKIDALLGPSGSPNAIAAIPFVAAAATPMLAVVGTQATVLPMDDQKHWVFKTTQNDNIMAQTLVEQMVKTGVKTVGFIGYSDSYGESWYKTMAPLLEKHNIRITANERYSRADSSVTGQSTKLYAAKPDVVFVAGVGAGAALPAIQLRGMGYKGAVYQTYGSASPDFIKVGGKAVEGTIMSASPMLVLPDIPDASPSKKVATQYVAAYQKMYGSTPPTFGAAFYDGGLLLQNAIPKALKQGKPGTKEFRSALRDALEATKNLVVSQGVYNMTPQDHSGFDQRGSVLVTIKDGKFRLLND
jgi:branched-chain amino acid transport system substrate-binding protein